MNNLEEDIINSLDPEDLVRILEISCAEVLEAFPDKLEEHMDKFVGVFDE